MSNKNSITSKEACRTPILGKDKTITLEEALRSPGVYKRNPYPCADAIVVTSETTKDRQAFYCSSDKLYGFAMGEGGLNWELWITNAAAPDKVVSG